MEPEVTVLEAAKILGVHPESVKRWIRYGELHAEKQGILYFIKRSDLDDVNTSIIAHSGTLRGVHLRNESESSLSVPIYPLLPMKRLTAKPVMNATKLLVAKYSSESSSSSGVPTQRWPRPIESTMPNIAPTAKCPIPTA
jgi:excisionase family DNA binding protein